MPKSKRAKVVTLGKVDKKGKDPSLKIYGGIRDASEDSQYIYVFAVDHMRNVHLKRVRSEFEDSRCVI
jgi:mRNA turnover protein 4